MKDNVLLFRQKKEAKETKLTPEIIRMYKDTILGVAGIMDELSKEDMVDAFFMMVQYNEMLMKYIQEELEGEIGID